MECVPDHRKSERRVVADASVEESFWEAPMLKAAVLVLADVESHGDLGRIMNALMTVKEFRQANDDVQLIFDGAATQWPVKLEQPDHPLHGLYTEIRDRVAGACEYCAGAFGVKEQLEALDLPLRGEQEGHPSLRRLVADGYEIISF
jgi:hypothetical protein